MNKKEMRNKYLLIRKFIREKPDKSNTIINAILQSPEYEEATNIAMYYSTKDEVCTFDLIMYSLLKNKRVLLPKVVGKEMIFVEVDGRTKYKTSKFKIREPISNEEFPKEKIDLMIVPGIAFDKSGARIGYGGGYYDRYLEGTNINTIGICFDNQITDEPIETEEHDIRVNAVQTERRRYDDIKRFNLR